MKTVSELTQAYKEKLYPHLQILEDERKKITQNLYVIFVPIMIGAVWITIAVKHPIGIFLGLIVGGAVTYFLTREYRINFKVKIVAKIIEFIDPDFIYIPNNRISEDKFVQSKLFGRFNRYRGDDYVKGKVGDTEIEFSELHVAYHTSNGKNSHTKPVFDGLFVIAEFNKNFKGKTIVLPDKAEKMFGGLGNFFQKANWMRGDLVKLEDTEFEKLFVVYSDDQIEARYILSTSFMQRIKDFRKKANKKIYISFVDTKIFVGIRYRKNLFEPNVFKTILDIKPIIDYYRDLRLAVDIIEDLKLNVRIWSKE
ncbi:MAG: DUF3137 domain-containing protein [Candidatus Omnitrophica bacterium]|nr:DUF3137 domain-containing protein [Candidatus Omnitrophota bacterium]MDD5080576.1 DUF3137 domain-containing protein [Candidatus Omnitrophota bacterium]MDD5441073.1 DUF3137 domain-containing protein [Candidatus Omnitrophota bacterium]